MLRLQTIKTIVNSRRFKGSSSDEPRRVQVLDLYCLTRFESENSRRGDVYLRNNLQDCPLYILHQCGSAMSMAML